MSRAQPKKQRACVTCDAEIFSAYRECHACRRVRIHTPNPCESCGAAPKVAGHRRLCAACLEDRLQGNYCTDCGQRTKPRQWKCDSCKSAWSKSYRQRAIAADPEKQRQKERDSHLRFRFKLTLEQYAEMLEAQGGGCAICGDPPPPGRVLHVDHDHSCCSGKRTCGQCVRALLCAVCNAIVGHLESGNYDPHMEYVRRWSR